MQFYRLCGIFDICILEASNIEWYAETLFPWNRSSVKTLVYVVVSSFPMSNDRNGTKDHLILQLFNVANMRSMILLAITAFMLILATVSSFCITE